MSLMSHRTTFSLDAQAIARLKSLSRRWKVSQAEVIRRALEAAEKIPFENSSLEAVRSFHQEGGLQMEQADRYLEEWTASRDEWEKG